MHWWRSCCSCHCARRRWTRFKTYRPQMVGELMFPVTRKQLVDCLFATVGCHVAAQWIAGCAAVAAGCRPVSARIDDAASRRHALVIRYVDAGDRLWLGCVLRRLVVVGIADLCNGTAGGLSIRALYGTDSLAARPVGKTHHGCGNGSHFLADLAAIVHRPGHHQNAHRKWLNLELG